MKKNIFIIIALLFFLTIGQAFLVADNIRGNLVQIISISDKTVSGKAYTFGLEDITGIAFDNNNLFIQGIEIELNIPSEIRSFRDGFALYLFKKINPDPDTNKRSFTGSRFFFDVIPVQNKVFLQIPVKANHNLHPLLGTILINEVVKPEEFPILLTILPVMKGIPSYISKSTFTIKAYPLIEDKGTLSLEVTFPDENQDPVFVYLDEKKVPYPIKNYPIKTGLHHLSIESEYFKKEYLTFGIEKGELTVCKIELVRLIPKLTIEAPENTIIFLDGEKIDILPGEIINISEGEHIVLFKLGDYKLSRKFSVNRGKTFKISLLLDILIQDN